MLDDKKGAEASERAKKMRELKKYGKQVQQDVLAKRQAEKKKMLDDVTRQRKSMFLRLSMSNLCLPCLSLVWAEGTCVVCIYIYMHVVLYAACPLMLFFVFFDVFCCC